MSLIKPVFFNTWQIKFSGSTVLTEAESGSAGIYEQNLKERESNEFKEEMILWMMALIKDKDTREELRTDEIW